MLNYDEIKQNKTYIILTYIGTFKLVQMSLMAPSPFSFIILSSLSTARNKEFHLVAFGHSSWREQASSSVSAARVDLPHFFQRALHLPNAEWHTFLYASLDVAFMASTVAIRLSRWQAQRWCCGSWNSKPSSSFRSADTSTNSTSSSLSWSSSSSPGCDALPGSPSLPTALFFSSSPKTWKAFMKLEPLSVVVCTIFPQISMSFRALANTSNVWEPQLLKGEGCWASFETVGVNPMASNGNEAPPSGRPAVSSGGDMVDSPHRLSHRLLHSHGGINYGAQSQPWYNFCIRLQFIHKISKWLLFNNMEWLEPLDHILQDSFVNGPLRHSPGVHQCGLPNGGGGGKSLRSPFSLSWCQLFIFFEVAYMLSLKQWEKDIL